MDDMGDMAPLANKRKQPFGVDSYPSSEDLSYTEDRQTSQHGGGGPMGSPEFQALKKRYSTYLSSTK